MKKIISLLFATFGLVGLIIAQTPTAMTKIDADEVPTEVLVAMSKTYPNQKVDQWFYFDEIYSAKTDAEGIAKYSRFNDEALMIEERVLWDWSEAPENLVSGKEKTEYKYWDVVEFYEIRKEGKAIHYFLKLKSDNNEIKTIYFDLSGKLEAKSNSGR